VAANTSQPIHKSQTISIAARQALAHIFIAKIVLLDIATKSRHRLSEGIRQQIFDSQLAFCNRLYPLACHRNPTFESFVIAKLHLYCVKILHNLARLIALTQAGTGTYLAPIGQVAVKV
jgi:hypothetical protein